jgi:hypothetical protein
MYKLFYPFTLYCTIKLFMYELCLSFYLTPYNRYKNHPVHVAATGDIQSTNNITEYFN